ncbi:MAG TPA: AmmeMemoRadiSam system protein B [Anaerolineales bacterium]|nr:AmmeMemoRadiSam system protein B [Anaerolineales bacterium]
MIDLRPSPIAGQWYEGDPDTLAQAVDQYIDDAQLPKLEGDVIGVIAPHAGHRYSGEVAGYAFSALRGLRPDLVVVVGAMHHPYTQPLLTTTHAGYFTPLGNIPVDKTALNDLDVLVTSELGFGFTPVANDPEHSLEIELPFLQRVFQHSWKLLPIMVRALDEKVSEGLGKTLATVLRDRNFVLVASTDLSHFFKQEAALAYDRAMLGEIEAFNPVGAFDLEHSRKGFACGLGAFTAVLWACKKLGADKVKVLRHATSANVTGDFSSVVGYGAAAILKS